jgi:hypothetical protein
MSVSCAAAISLVLAVTPAFTQPSGAPGGIKVHGEWTLSVRNPDGSLAAVHEFKNGAAAVPVVADQLVEVKVVISFS